MNDLINVTYASSHVATKTSYDSNLSTYTEQSVESRGITVTEFAGGPRLHWTEGQLDLSAMRYGPIWQGVKLISGDVAKCPLEVHKRTGAKSREVAPNHPTYDLVRFQPAPLMGAFKFWRKFMIQLILWSNAYARIYRDGLGNPVRLQIWESSLVTTSRDRDTNKLTYWYLNKDGEWEAQSPFNVLHVEDISLHKDREEYGGRTSPTLQMVNQAKGSIALGLAIERFGQLFFENGGRIGGILEVPLAMGKQSRDNLEEGFRGVYENIESAFKTVILRGGSKFHAGQINPDETQMAESREKQVEDAARWLNCPKHKLGADSSVSYGSLEQENRSYVDSTLSPHFHAIADECELKLIQPLKERKKRKWFYEFDSSELLQTDLASLYDLGVKGINGRLTTTNEERFRIGLNPVKFGDTIQGPVNVSVVDDKEPPKPEPITNEEDEEPEVEPEEVEDEEKSLDVDLLLGPFIEALTKSLKTLSEQYKRKSKIPNFNKWKAEEFPTIVERKVDDALSTSLKAACYVTSQEFTGKRNAIYNRLVSGINDDTTPSSLIESILTEEGFNNGKQ